MDQKISTTDEFPQSLTPEQIATAIDRADAAVIRDGFKLRDPHDLNNLRTTLGALAHLLKRKGRDGIHTILTTYSERPQYKHTVEPLVYRAIEILAQELNVELTSDEQAAIDAAKRGINREKAHARQQADDIQTDMLALKEDILTDSVARKNAKYATRHNPEAYRQHLFDEGIPADEAETNTAWLAITLEAIGQKMEEFKPTQHNPVDYFNLTVEHVLDGNRQRDPASVPPSLVDYVHAWQQEVKQGLMGARDPKNVRAAFHVAITEITEPGPMPALYRRRRIQHEELPSAMRYFRDHTAQLDSSHVMATQPQQAAIGILIDLSRQFKERHDVTGFIQNFMQGRKYQQQDVPTRRLLNRAFYQTCAALEVPNPKALSEKIDDREWQDRMDEQRASLHQNGRTKFS